MVFKFRLLAALFVLHLTGVDGMLLQGQNVIPDSTTYYTNLLNESYANAKSYPDVAYFNLEKSYQYFANKKDTLNQVNVLLQMGDIQDKRGKYSIAFDHLWEAQYLSEQFGRKYHQAVVNIRLGRLYDNFNMVDQALMHYNRTLMIGKEMYQRDEGNVVHLISGYMNLAVRQRKSGNYDLAQAYLDSCLINDKVSNSSSIERPFIDAERGYIMLKLGDLNQAFTFLIKSFENTQGKNVTYYPNINMYLGEYYETINQPDSAIYYYTKSLNHIRNRKSRVDLESEVLYRLSEVYSSLGRIHRAYNYIGQSKLVADSLLELKNETNRELFEIKNTYLRSIFEKNEKLETQEIIIEQNKKVQSRLKIILGLLVVLGLVLVLIIRMRLKLRNTLTDKKEAELKAKLTEEKSLAELSMKSKELTSYALQLIDKDASIDELLEILKKESSPSYSSMKIKLKKGSANLWEEFNLRFTKVNTAFYQRLQAKHPNLSLTEQKHCALIKLKFATKEMARILNIEIHSVHISRSRIRKKIGLERSESLEDYIADL